MLLVSFLNIVKTVILHTVILYTIRIIDLKTGIWDLLPKNLKEPYLL